MSIHVLTYVFISVMLSASAQLCLKFGMSRPAVQLALAGNDTGVTVWTVATNVWVIGGLTFYGWEMSVCQNLVEA